MVYPENPSTGSIIPAWSDPLHVTPSSSWSSMHELSSIFDHSNPSPCSSRTSCTEDSFDLDPSPSSSLDSLESGRSYHGSPTASFLYPDYPDFTANFGFYVHRLNQSSTGLSSSLSEDDDILTPSSSVTSLQSCQSYGIVSQSSSCTSSSKSSACPSSASSTTSLISIGHSGSVISISSSDSITATTSSHTIISVASSASCDDAQEYSFSFSDQRQPIDLPAVFFDVHPYRQFIAFSNPSSPSTSFTSLYFPAGDAMRPDFPVPVIPIQSSKDYSPVTGCLFAIRDQPQVSNRKRKRYEDGDNDDEEEWQPCKRQCM